MIYKLLFYDNNRCVIQSISGTKSEQRAADEDTPSSSPLDATAFCVDKWTVLEFSLTGTLTGATDAFTASLLINDVSVAETTFDDDNDSPSHFSLIYRGSITTACGVEVQVASASAATIPV